MVAKNPGLKTKEVFEAGPETRPAFDGDFRRSTVRRQPSSSSSSSSNDSEEQNLQAELEKLLTEHKKIQEKKAKGRSR